VRRRLVVSLAVGALAASSACSSSDGRALPPPAPRPSTTTTTSEATLGPGEETGPFTLQSTAFADGAVIPERLTCTGDAVSPDLSWTGAPADTTGLALVVRDRNAGGFVHWVVSDIDPFVQGIGEAGVPENAVEHRNDAGTIGWLAPCPPAGSGTHTYEVVVLALPGVVSIPEDATGAQAAALLEASASERAVLTGTVTAGG
jgi:Raf kinase inhibitor-like YbhB/YbcL family protein